MSSVKLLDATPQGTVTFEFLIDERYTNINGVMHGGAAGVIFDMCTTTALGPLARPGYWECVPFLCLLFYLIIEVGVINEFEFGSFLGGVTRTLNISYLKAIPIGICCLIPLREI